MAHASRKHIGPGSQGKGTGTGALTDIEPEEIPANMILSNRDKAQHSDERGLDGRAVLTEQMQEHALNHAEDPTGQLTEDVLVDVAENPVEPPDAKEADA
jgi:hypothetical protein